jgi:4-amino-4-deoxy-L-arabinose transferase-like glycosyltransferase
MSQLLRHKYLIALVIVVFFGFVLRFYRLGLIPASLDWDEAALGWNTYSFLKTGSDEYGNAHPVSIRSFNDYKPPLYVYTSIPIVGLLGLSEFSIRLLSALAGTGTILLMYPLTLLLTKNPKAAILAAFVASFTPWSLQFSRVAFESNLAVFWVVAGVTSLLWFIRSRRLVPLLVSAVSLVLAIYSYHSTRLFVPVFILIFGLINWRTFWQTKKVVLLCLFLSVLLLVPLIRSTLRVGSLQARFSTVSIFSPDSLESTKETSQDKIRRDLNSGDYLGFLTHQPIFTYATILAKNHLDHFNLDFLFLNGDANERHHAPGVGMLLILQFPLIVMGFYFMAKRRLSWGKVIIIWLLVGPLAAAITTTTPHAVRAMVMLPPWIIVSAYGLLELAQLLRKRQLLSFFAVCLLLVLNLYFYLNRYFVQMPVQYAKSWQFGYKELVQYVLSNEKDYDQIYITGAYDQPYIYFLFYGRISPVVKNNTFFYKSMDKYIFANYCEVNQTPQMKNQKLLIVLAPQESTCPTPKLQKTILFPDGKPAFLISSKL